jgi:hypothetical protein
VTSDRDQILSEFIDAWNAGRRPDVDDHLARVPEQERAELADQLVSFLSFAPTPDYDEDALAAIRAEPVVADALAAPSTRGGLLPDLLVRLRERLSWTTPQVAGELVRELGLPDDQAGKTASYLRRLERRQLDPSGVSGQVFEALARLFGVPPNELEGAADLGGWASGPARARTAMAFRADDRDAAEAVSEDLELLADALHAPGDAARDEVDDLFLGGR